MRRGATPPPPWRAPTLAHPTPPRARGGQQQQQQQRAPLPLPPVGAPGRGRGRGSGGPAPVPAIPATGAPLPPCPPAIRSRTGAPDVPPPGVSGPVT